MPKYSFVAIYNSKIVGVAGFKTAENSLLGGFSFKILKEKIGVLKAIRALAVLLLLDREVKKGELLMDGIVVSRDMRGKGIWKQTSKAYDRLCH